MNDNFKVDEEIRFMKWRWVSNSTKSTLRVVQDRKVLVQVEVVYANLTRDCWGFLDRTVWRICFVILYCSIFQSANFNFFFKGYTYTCTSTWFLSSQNFIGWKSVGDMKVEQPSLGVGRGFHWTTPFYSSTQVLFHPRL